LEVASLHTKSAGFVEEGCHLMVVELPTEQSNTMKPGFNTDEVVQ
jgi:hypothetical protein